jgi:hypothetical protein
MCHREFIDRKVAIRAVNGRDKVAGELGHQPDDKFTLLCDVPASARLVRKDNA